MCKKSNVTIMRISLIIGQILRNLKIRSLAAVTAEPGSGLRDSTSKRFGIQMLRILYVSA